MAGGENRDAKRRWMCYHAERGNNALGIKILRYIVQLLFPHPLGTL